MALDFLTFRPLSVDITFSQITHRVLVNNSTKTIIDNASGHFQNGRLHAILGPSGSGKSSLLNVLAGFNPVASGAISFNGSEYPVSKWADIISSARSYIMQDDFLVPELTVKEQIAYSVDFKVPSETKTEQREAMVKTILSLIKLEESADRKIKVLSGGQRKRLCVASELPNYPPIIFLDEPTTGLDSTSCYRLVDLLKSLAQSGCNVIATIHQPNSRVFAMFDTVTVLAEGGRIAYSGPASSLAGTISSVLHLEVPNSLNPAEYLFQKGIIESLANVAVKKRENAILQVSQSRDQHQQISTTNKSWARLDGDDSANSAVKEYRRNTKKKDIDTVTIKVDVDDVKSYCEASLPGSGHRFSSLFRRTLIQSRRDIVFMVGRVCAYLMACVMGILFQGVGKDRSQILSNVGFIFLISLVFTSGPSIVAMMTSHSYLNVLIREQVNNVYGVSAFYLSRAIVEAAMNVVLGSLFSLAMWMMSGQPQETVPAIFILMLLFSLHSIASHHFAYMMALFVDPSATAQLPFAAMMLHVVFCGYFVPSQNMPTWIFWMKYINTDWFAFSALMKLVYGVVAGHSAQIPCKQERNPLCFLFRDGKHVLESWGVDTEPESFWTDIFIIIKYTAGFIILGFLLTFLYVRKARRAIARL